MMQKRFASLFKTSIFQGSIPLPLQQGQEVGQAALIKREEEEESEPEDMVNRELETTTL